MYIDFDTNSDLMIHSLYGRSTQIISSLAYDSRSVLKGSIFFCTSGGKSDGHEFIEEALIRGASVIVGTDKQILKKFVHTYSSCTFITVSDPKSTMTRLSILFYKESYKNIFTFAITGTNGKTTTTAYIRSLLNQLNVATGSIGTLGIMNDKEEMKLNHSTHTTPEVSDLHDALDQFHQQGLQAAAIEITSIAIEQQRIENMTFNIGIHTNLTPEHLDFHSDFKSYKKAKLKLFQQVNKAVVNIDDLAMSQDILNTFTGSIMTYGLNPIADVSAQNIKTAEDGTNFKLHIDGQIHTIYTPIIGSYNILNLLAAICACLYLDIPIEPLIKATQHIKAPNGRFQLLKDYPSHKIILDYAHTPNGLENVVKTVQNLPHKRIILMITGVGLRDPNQLPDMARAVENQAHEIIVSVDHPGFFDRQMIIEDVLKGFKNPNATNIHQILHREDAIHKALTIAKKDDIVLITGLGYGGYQVIGDENVPYSDWEVVRDFFEKQTQSSDAYLKQEILK